MVLLEFYSFGTNEICLPSRKVKLLPGSILLTIPLNCAPGGELRVTSIVNPMNWFDMLTSGALQAQRNR